PVSASMAMAGPPGSADWHPASASAMQPASEALRNVAGSARIIIPVSPGRPAGGAGAVWTGAGGQAPSAPAGGGRGARLARNEAFALRPLAGQLARPPHALGLFACLL